MSPTISKGSSQVPMGFFIHAPFLLPGLGSVENADLWDVFWGLETIFACAECSLCCLQLVHLSLCPVQNLKKLVCCILFSFRIECLKYNIYPFYTSNHCCNFLLLAFLHLSVIFYVWIVLFFFLVPVLASLSAASIPPTQQCAGIHCSVTLLVRNS